MPTTSGPGLVEQLQSDAMDDSVSITVLLRKAKATAIKLKQTELAGWIEHEMSGYPDGAELPEYRKLFASLKFLNPMRGWCPVVGGDFEFGFGGSMAEISSLLSSDSDTFMAPVPFEIVQGISRNIGFNVDVKRQISRSSVAAIVEAVRNAIHDWALRLEQAGIHGEGISFTPRDAEKAQSVIVNIGSIGNATGLGAFGDNATITANQSIDVKQMAQEVKALVKKVEEALPVSDLPADVKATAGKQLVELKSAASAAKPDESRIRKGLHALRGTMENAAGNLISAGVVALIVKIIGG
jgi:hypothetical protein